MNDETVKITIKVPTPMWWESRKHYKRRLTAALDAVSVRFAGPKGSPIDAIKVIREYCETIWVGDCAVGKCELYSWCRNRSDAPERWVAPGEEADE